MAAIGNALADDVLREAFATKEFRKVLRPVIGMETFNAGPRGRRRQVPPPVITGSSARIAWFETLGASTERDRPAPDVALPATDRGPRRARPRPGDGVLVTRSRARSATSSTAARRETATSTPIDHKGGDVLAVPHGPYVDTTPGVEGDNVYAVASLSSIDAPVGPVSAPVRPAPDAEREGEVSVVVDAARSTGPVQRPWRPIIGSEHLALLLRGEGPGGLPTSARTSRRRSASSATSSASRSVRAHAILHDVLGVYREDEDGTPRYDFDKVDLVIDRLLATGLRPVVELSFMPKALAADPEPSVFDYIGLISPPRDLDRWADLVEALVRHLVARHGLDEVIRWGFEVWNEANIKVFWAGRQSDYFDLYDAAARAVKAVDRTVARSAGRRRRPRAGSTTCSITPPRPACRSTS